jgi:hypothetical protein
MTKLKMLVSLSLGSLSLLACADSSETRLDHAQILAVRAEPANVAPGERARIDILAGDEAGNVYEAMPDAVSAVGAMGPLAVEQTAEGWFVTAGEQPDIATLSVSLTIDGAIWPATKKLIIGQHADNPRIEIQIDGMAATEMVARAGTKPLLTAVPAGAEPFTYAWYSSVGDLKYFRQQTAELDAVDPATGQLLLVLRDSMGGVSWAIRPARVE